MEFSNFVFICMMSGKAYHLTSSEDGFGRVLGVVVVVVKRWLITNSGLKVNHSFNLVISTRPFIELN